MFQHVGAEHEIELTVLERHGFDIAFVNLPAVDRFERRSGPAVAVVCERDVREVRSKGKGVVPAADVKNLVRRIDDEIEVARLIEKVTTLIVGELLVGVIELGEGLDALAGIPLRQ